LKNAKTPTISDIKEINRRVSIGEACARQPSKEMVEANLRLLFPIEKYTNRGLQSRFNPEGQWSHESGDKFEYRQATSSQPYATWYVRLLPAHC
jgi:RNA polymerase primary sigma factor